jgi:hypothetical protein
MDKHSSLLRALVDYGCKKFCNIGPWKPQKMTDDVIKVEKIKILRDNLWGSIGMERPTKAASTEATDA